MYVYSLLFIGVVTMCVVVVDIRACEERDAQKGEEDEKERS